GFEARAGGGVRPEAGSAPAQQLPQRSIAGPGEGVHQRHLDGPVPPVVEVDGGEDSLQALVILQFATHEQGAEEVEVGNRGTPGEPSYSFVGFHHHDRLVEPGPWRRIPGGQEWRVERQRVAVRLEGGEPHTRSVSWSSRSSLTGMWQRMK